MKKNILITCFDISGDHNTYELFLYYLDHLKPLHSKYHFSFIAGEKVAKLAQDHPDLSVLADHITESAIGIFESLKYVYSTLKFFKSFKQLLRREKIDLLFCVDGQGRNLTLGKIAKSFGIKTVYYFPPPVSQFGKWNVRKMNVFDLILCPFKADHLIFEQVGLHSVFTGHPFLNYFDPSSVVGKKVSLAKKNPLWNKPGKPLISIFPGSRFEEVKNLTPVFLTATKILQKKFPQTNWVISISHQSFIPSIKEQLKKHNLNIEIVHDRSEEIMANSYFILCCSGTATLKAAFLGIPHLIAYHLSFINYWAAKLMMELRWFIYVRFIGMVNILADREVVKEFIHYRLNPQLIVEEASLYLSNPEKRNAKSQELLDECHKSFSLSSPKSQKLLENQPPKTKVTTKQFNSENNPENNPFEIIWREVDSLFNK